jgi:hypothetical protein
MLLLTKPQRAQLLKNGAVNNAARNLDGRTVDHKPVVKFFTPWGGATWLLAEITESDDTDSIMFGLCGLGMGEPELGYVSLAELQSIKGPFGLKVERDLWFTADKTLTEYARDAREKGRIAA